MPHPQTVNELMAALDIPENFHPNTTTGLGRCSYPECHRNSDIEVTFQGHGREMTHQEKRDAGIYNPYDVTIITEIPRIKKLLCNECAEPAMDFLYGSDARISQ